MSIARVTMHEFIKEEDIAKTEAWYDSVREELFPTAEQVINIKTGPTSLISIAIYPSFEDAARNLEGREKMMEQLSPMLKDGFSTKERSHIILSSRLILRRTKPVQSTRPAFMFGRSIEVGETE